MDTHDDHPSRSHSTLRRVIILLLAVVAVGFYGRYAYTQHGTQQAVASVLDIRLQNLENTLVLQERRIEKLEEGAQKSTAKAPAAANTPANADEEKRIAALEKQIGTLQSAQPAEDRQQLFQAIHLLSSFHHFSDKVLTGQPFTAELTAFESQVGNNEDITRLLSALMPYADSGIPTFAELLSSFDDSVDQLDATETSLAPDAGLWARFVYTLKHLINIRRIDDNPTGNSADAIVARASAHLDRQEIEGAMAELRTLPDPARGHFSDWLDDAEAQTQAPAIIDQLEELVMQQAFHTEAPKPAAKGSEQ